VVKTIECDMKTDNELIAEFMGRIPNTHRKNESSAPEDYFETEAGKFGYWELNSYDTSWDWIMPVVEKIESIVTEVEICNSTCVISNGTPQGDGGKFYETIVDSYGTSKIDATYKAIVDFIKWYKSQPKP
jgi:hypothetical protein